MLSKPNRINQKIALLLQGVFIITLIFSGCEQPDKPHQLSGKTMGTTYSILYYGDDSGKSLQSQLQKKVDSLLAELNQQMSTFIPESEISRLNAWTGNGDFQISDHFRNVMESCLAWQSITNGALDISVLPLVTLWGFGPGRWNNDENWKPPSDSAIEALMEGIGPDFITLTHLGISKKYPQIQIDVSAITKGYAVDQVSELLKQHHIANFLVEIGGEVRARGKKPDGNHWQIGIDHPAAELGERKILNKKIDLVHQSMGTSGNYRNFRSYQGSAYSHIIDSRTGYPVSNRVASVSVITKKCMDADALATALIVLGFKEGSALVESLSGYEAIWVLKTADGFETITSEGLDLGSGNIYAAGGSSD